MLFDTLIVSRGCGCAEETKEKQLGEISDVFYVLEECKSDLIWGNMVIG